MTRTLINGATFVLAACGSAVLGTSTGHTRQSTHEAAAHTALAVGGTGALQLWLPQFRSEVDLVLLDVCVRDDNGQFERDLSIEDFLVFENGVRQQVSLLVPSNAVRLNAVLLLDMSQSMDGPKLDRALEAARQFATWFNAPDRLEIIAFTQRSMRVQGFDDTAPGPGALPLALRAARTSIGSTGSTALYDALLVAVGDLTPARMAKSPDTRDVIILLSDGEDTASLVGFEEVLPVVRRSGVLVYSVSLRANLRGDWLGPNWPMLQFARDTGARAMGVPKLDALPELYREIDAEVRHLYRLGYVSTNTRRDGQWRSISVRVSVDHARARTRAGYYASRSGGLPQGGGPP